MVTKSKCLGCGKKIDLSQTLCNACFLKSIEKRIRKDIRTNTEIEPGANIELLNDNSKEYRMVKTILRNIFGSHLTIKEVKKVSKNTFIPTNLERVVNDKLSIYLENKKNNHQKKNLMHNVLEEEVVRFCKLNKLVLGNLEEKNEFVESVEKIYPKTKFALAKSLQKIFEK